MQKYTYNCRCGASNITLSFHPFIPCDVNNANNLDFHTIRESCLWWKDRKNEEILNFSAFQNWILKCYDDDDTDWRWSQPEVNHVIEGPQSPFNISYTMRVQRRARASWLRKICQYSFGQKFRQHQFNPIYTCRYYFSTIFFASHDRQWQIRKCLLESAVQRQLAGEEKRKD